MLKQYDLRMLVPMFLASTPTMLTLSLSTWVNPLRKEGTGCVLTCGRHGFREVSLYTKTEHNLWTFSNLAPPIRVEICAHS